MEAVFILALVVFMILGLAWIGANQDPWGDDD